ncbi:MAG: hypothetical protein VXB01_07510 [Opitutae bacterium]
MARTGSVALKRKGASPGK